MCFLLLGVVVGQLTASDGDGDMARFSIVTGGGDRFLIDAETGEITVGVYAYMYALVVW